MNKALAKILCILFIFLLLAPAAADSASTDFTDTQGHWSAPYAQWAYEQKLMTGISEAKFAPDHLTTRAMAIMVLYRLSGETASNESHSFQDVADTAYYAHAVQWGVKNGIVAGVSEDRFAPNSTVRRQDFITMLYRYEQYANAMPNQSSPHSNYFQESMDWAVNYGIIQGTGDYRIHAAQSATRGEFAAILKRYSEIDEYEDPGVLYEIDPLAVHQIILRQSGESRIIDRAEDIQDFCEKLNGYRYSEKIYQRPVEGWSNGIYITANDGKQQYLGEISRDSVVIHNVIFVNAEPSNGNYNSYFTDEWFAEWFTM